jgi:hypothetical protein
VRTALICLTAAALVTFSCSEAAAASARPLPRITFVTPRVSQYGILTVRASVTPKTARCSLRLIGPRAQRVSLPARRGRAGTLQWSYRLKRDAATGGWLARVSCAGTSVSHVFLVEAAAVPNAKVVVINSGFTQSNYATGGPFISYGAVLHNDSSDVDALNVNVAVSFTGTAGSAVATQSTTLTGIPADASFYLGGLTSSNVSLTPAAIKVSIKVGSTQTHRLTLPAVSGLSLQTDSDGDGAISGTFSNPYQRSTPSTSQIYVIYLNAQGQIIGGASEFLGAAVSPGASVPFSFDSFSTTINDSFISPGNVATIDGSVDPCDGIPGLSCPAQIAAPTG